MRSDQPDYYKLLGVNSKATIGMIKKAFAALQTKFAAETGGNPERSPEFQQITHAYEVLSNPERRAVYDSLLVDTSSPLLEINVQKSREQISLLDTAQLIYLLVEIRPPSQNAEANLPLNLCLVLDRSTSMQGERLDQVKAAVELVVDKLSPDDVVSIISFSDRAEVVVPIGQVNNKHILMARIRSILASGGTEIFQGLHAGIQEMQQVPLSQYNNHLILLTDGHTYGDAELCLRLAKETAAHKIGISAFGIGSEWNDQFLDRLVAASGGQSGFIETPEQIIEFLRQRIKDLGAVYARNVRLLPEIHQNSQIQYAFKLKPYPQPLPIDAKEIRLGDIEGRSPLLALLEVSIDPQAIETRIKLSLNFLADIPSQGIQDRAFKQQTQILVLSEAEQIEPPEILLKAVRMLNMYRMNERVWEEVEAGHLEMATTRMRHLTTRLLEAGETKLAQQAHMEVQRLATMGTLSVEGRKRLKYGTRTLIGQTMSLDLEEDDHVQ